MTLRLHSKSEAWGTRSSARRIRASSAARHLRGRCPAPGHALSGHRTEPLRPRDDQEDRHREGPGHAGRAGRDHRPGPRQVQPALDADAHVGHADGAAGREGDVPAQEVAAVLATSRYTARDGVAAVEVEYEPLPSWWIREGARARPPCCGRTRRTRRTTTSGTGNGATGRPPTARSARPTSG